LRFHANGNRAELWRAYFLFGICFFANF